MTGVNKKQMVGIFAFAIFAMASNMTMGILALIMQSYPTVSPTTVSQILTTPALVGTAYAFCVGVLHKKVPAKILMMLAQVCLFAYGMIFCFLGGKAPIGVLIAAAGLLGIGQGSNNTLLAIVLAEACPDESKRGGILGIVMSVMNLGGVAITTLGGMLAVNGWNNAYLIFFVLLITLTVQAICLPKGAFAGAPAAAAEKKEKTKLPMKVWAISIHYFFFFLALYVFGTNVSEYIITTYALGTSAEAGVASSMVTVGGIVAGAFFGAYSKVLKKATVPVLMGIAAVGLLVPIFVTTSIVAIFACGLLLGISMMGCNPYIMGYMAQITTPDQYSNALSIFAGFMNGGMCVAISVLAFMTKLLCGDGAHVPTKFIVGAGLAIICFITSFPIYMGKDKK